MAKTWIGITADWQPVKFRDHTQGKAALLPFRKQRLPWLSDQSRILVAIHGGLQLLLLYKLDHMMSYELDVPAAFLKITARDLTLKILAEFLDWPMCEAAWSGFARQDLVETTSQSWLGDAALKCWNKKPLPDWTPVHRGALGLSFLRDVKLKSGVHGCLELTAQALILYNGSLAENEALLDRKIRQRWTVTAMEFYALNAVLDDETSIMARLLMRRYRQWVFQHQLEYELPF
jgi:hypothetical protein